MAKGPLSYIHCLFLVIMTSLSMSPSVWGKDNCVRSHLEAPVTISDTVMTRTLSSGGNYKAESMSVEVRGALTKTKEGVGLSKDYWGLTLLSPADTVDISLRFGNTDFGDILDRRTAYLRVDNNRRALYDAEVDGFRMSAGNLNTLSVSLDNNTLNIYGGGDNLRHLASVDVSGLSLPQSVNLWSVGQLLVTVLSTEVCTSPTETLDTRYTPRWLDERFSSSRDPLEGYWTYFDRSTDPSYAHIGGKYTLAIVREDGDTAGDDNLYRIVYVSGAVTCADKWRSMMLKGSLSPTIFQGHYNLRWIDSTFEAIDEDAHCTLDTEDSLLTLSFPLLKSTIRFSKMIHKAK